MNPILMFLMSQLMGPSQAQAPAPPGGRMSTQPPASPFASKLGKHPDLFYHPVPYTSPGVIR